MTNTDKEIWIFLSHSNEDYEKVRRVRNILEEMDMRPLMFFLKCLNDNDEIEDLIKREIKARTRFLLCNSDNARKSNWVAKEINYITELQKPYDVIEISENEESLREQLKNCFRRDHIFISYPKELYTAINIVQNRLSKYDFCTTFINKFDIIPDIPLIEYIKRNIEKAVDNGKFITILSHHSLPKEKVSQFELQQALELASNRNAILPIYLDEISKEYFSPTLSSYDSIDLSNAITHHEGFLDAKDIPERHGKLGNETDLERLGDDIVNAILVRLQGWGNIETYADCFRHGIGLDIDITEADKLGDLVVEHLESVDCSNHFNGPGMLIRLGGLFKEGRVVKQNYKRAREYYESAHHEWGINVDNLLSSLY